MRIERQRFIDQHLSRSRERSRGLASDAGSMVRIAIGRDAADTAFLDNHKGAITLKNMTVTAVVAGELPEDSVDQLVSLR